MKNTCEWCKEWEKQAKEELGLIRTIIRGKIKEMESALRDLQAAERTLLQFSRKEASND